MDNEPILIKPSALQKTKLYIQAQKRIDRTKVVEDSLDYYLKQLLKLEEKKANFEFINELLDKNGIDINHLSKTCENVLFQVNVTLSLNHLTSCEEFEELKYFSLILELPF